MPSLYEIDQAIMNCIDFETGEVIDLDKLTELQMQRENKFEGVALWIKNLKADAEALKAEKEVFVEREKQTKAKIERLQEWLSKVLEGQKFNTAKVMVSFRKSESVGINDVNTIPKEYMVQTVTEAPDKNKIKAALKTGVEISGCTLEVKNNIQIK